MNLKQIAVILAICITGYCATNTNRVYNNVISFSPVGYALSAIVGVIDLPVEIQHKLNNYFSISLVPELAYNYRVQYYGGAIGGSINLWPIGTGIEGLYFSMVPVMGWVSKENTMFFEINMNIGWQWIFENGFIICIGAGCGYNSKIGLVMKANLPGVGFVFN